MTVKMPDLCCKIKHAVGLSLLQAVIKTYIHHCDIQQDAQQDQLICACCQANKSNLSWVKQTVVNTVPDAMVKSHQQHIFLVLPGSQIKVVLTM